MSASEGLTWLLVLLQQGAVFVFCAVTRNHMEANDLCSH